MIQFNVMFRTGDERKRREKSVGIGKSSQAEGLHLPILMGVDGG